MFYFNLRRSRYEPEAEEASDGVIDGARVNDDGEVIEDGEGGDRASAPGTADEDAEEDGTPPSDLLIRLTAHRTLGLRLALGEQPDMALIAVIHALAAQTFYRGVDVHCLDIRPNTRTLRATRTALRT